MTPPLVFSGSCLRLNIDTGAHRQIKPRGLLPFGLEERDAHKEMNDWLGRLWFAWPLDAVADGRAVVRIDGTR